MEKSEKPSGGLVFHGDRCGDPKGKSPEDRAFWGDYYDHGQCDYLPLWIGLILVFQCCPWQR